MSLQILIIDVTEAVRLRQEISGLFCPVNLKTQFGSSQIYWSAELVIYAFGYNMQLFRCFFSCLRREEHSGFFVSEKELLHKFDAGTRNFPLDLWAWSWKIWPCFISCLDIAAGGPREKCRFLHSTNDRNGVCTSAFTRTLSKLQ